ncbi:hypothetical protein CDD83_5262 [Cordyceps sp. RAO-2017]|nr:hypothetical protein CDD83_5262 [Cordyceps sp. RAO-2017]
MLSLREVLDSKAPGEEGHGLDRVDAVRALQESVVAPVERAVREAADRLVRDFALPATMTFAQADEVRARTESALATLYLLSPTAGVRPDRWTPRLLLQALETYVRSALQTSLTALSRALGQLPTLDRALADVTAKCQNLVALEIVLGAAKPPDHPLLPSLSASSSASATAAATKHHNFIQPLLAHLETGSLASYFWRTMAGGLASRVQDIVARPGVVARTLKANRANVGDAIRQAVIRGCQPPSALAGPKSRGRAAEANWDREIAVMVGSVVNNLGGR